MCERCTQVSDLDDLDKILAVRYVKNPDTAAAAGAQHGSVSGEASTPAAAGSRRRAMEFHIKPENASYLHTKWVPEHVMQEAANAYQFVQNRLRAFMQRVDDAGASHLTACQVFFLVVFLQFFANILQCLINTAPMAHCARAPSWRPHVCTLLAHQMYPCSCAFARSVNHL